MNKKNLVRDIKRQIEEQYNSITQSLKSSEEIDKLSLGTSGIYLNSILGYLSAVEYLLDRGLIESAGSAAASLWERSITLQYLLTNPIELSREYTLHRKVKKSPWRVKEMVKGIIDSEKLSKHRCSEIEKDLLYFQYTYLCAIKHGNPYTLSYLNRFKVCEQNDDMIGVHHQNYLEEDDGLKNWISSVSCMTALETLLKFSKTFCYKNKIDHLEVMLEDMARTIVNESLLTMPQVIVFDVEEFRDDFLDYLKRLLSCG